MSLDLHQVFTNLIADAQTHIDTAHAIHLEHGIDTFPEAYRDAFTALADGLYRLARSNA